MFLYMLTFHESIEDDWFAKVSIFTCFKESLLDTYTTHTYIYYVYNLYILKYNVRRVQLLFLATTLIKVGL